MLCYRRIFTLPAGLLALLATFAHPTQAQVPRWPYNLPSHIKYYPEDEAFVRRDESIKQKLEQHAVVGVKKMSDNEGEKFFLDYWTFPPMDQHGLVEDEDHGHRLNETGEKEKVVPHWFNETMTERVIPPLLLHSTQNSLIESSILSRYVRFPILRRSELGKRDFQCPAGTSSCASINRPNSCCAIGQTCQLIQDTGLGDVGCCNAGETCAGLLSTCASDYTSCPNFPGGGCCIPGYACVSGGCLLSSTATVIVTPLPSPTQLSSSVPTATTTTTVSSDPSTSTTVAAPPPSTSLSSTVTPSSLTVSNTLICSSGFRSCPASLGGGCCPTDRACGRDTCPELSSTGTVGAPVRPTSDTPTTTSDASITGCPTGFYACSAFYQGGCCRYGRDCAPTSCPGSVLTTLIDSNGLSIVVTASSDLSANPILTGACATGWSTCATSDGGGCCPTGYVCGSSCTATATVSGLQASEVGKLAPSGAVREVGRENMVFALHLAFMVFIYLVI